MRLSEEYFRDVELRLKRLTDETRSMLSAKEDAEVRAEIRYGEYGEAVLVLAHMLVERAGGVSRESIDELRSLAELMGISGELPGSLNDRGGD